MPSNRRSNAAAKKNSRSRSQSSSSRRSSSKAKAKPRAKAQAPVLSSTQNDIVGVAVAVLAVAMFIAVVAPSTAVVTSAVGQALTLAFGAGALLFPVALFVFAMTFFMDEDGPISGRVAGGLLLVVLAVLAMLSINLPGVETMPDLVITPGTLESAGGYVGGGIAWGLLKLVGRVVGNVLLVGLIIAGIVVCGFSISGAVSKIHARLAEANDSIRERAEIRREERLEARARAEAEAAAWADEDERQVSLFDEDGDRGTSFIGNRKTSVLKRGRNLLLGRDRSGQGDQEPSPVEDVAETPATEPTPSEAAPTTLLVRDDAQAAEQEQHEGESVPAFLSGKARGRKGRHKDGPVGEQASGEVIAPDEGEQAYELPPMSILQTNPNSDKSAESDDALERTALKLQSTLEEFGLKSRVVGWTAGPVVTTYQISMGEGERVSKIMGLQEDLQLALAAKSVRIFTIPSTSYVGIEVPNDRTQPVFLADVLPEVKGGPLDTAFGRDSEGRPITVDLAKLPHLLVAGTTGSGKSVLLNSIVMSMLMRATPEQVRLIMVDPKRVEFSAYAGLPHLYVPVVTEPKKAASALAWGVTEMERRLNVFAHYGVRQIKDYNKAVEDGRWADMDNPPRHMPYFVIVIDELADLMMVAGKDVESSIVRIAQLGRAAGIHLIVATQRPSADVITGLIKANIDNRVALSVDNGMNSRIILDEKGAEKLLGNGDMLVKLRGRKPRRAQGCFVDDSEVAACVSYVRDHAEADFHNDILTLVEPGTPGAAGNGASNGAPGDDPLIWEAAKLVVDSQLGSTSGLQRALSVGYARAGRIMDMLEAKGVVGPANGSKPRDVLLDKEGLEDLMAAEADYGEV